MKRLLLAATFAAVPFFTAAQVTHTVTSDVVEAHILPRFQALADRAAMLAQTAQNNCAPTSQTLRAAYVDAFDAWVSVSHLRFGPTEVNDRAFALAFWPDSRGATPKSLATLIADQDPIARSQSDYAQVSIAARGFYAMEFLLFDEALSTADDATYHCTLVKAVTADIASTSAQILHDWQSNYAQRLLEPAATGTYRSQEEAHQELFKALTTGLQFTSETRLGRPLGTFDRPRPKRAEAWRSERSAHHVNLSLTALRDLAMRLSDGDPHLAEQIGKRFGHSIGLLANLDDPVFAGVAIPQSRLKVEVIQQSVNNIREIVQNELGPTLGVAAGFNSLDGD